MLMSLWKVTHIDAGCHRHRLLLRGMTKEQVQDRAEALFGPARVLSTICLGRAWPCRR